MRKQKQHTEASVKKDYTGGKISRRTAKIRLAVVHPGNEKADVAKRNGIMSGWIRDKQAINSRARKDKRQQTAA